MYIYLVLLYRDRDVGMIRILSKPSSEARDWVVPSLETRFFWWIRERHRIYERRMAGKPWPWTSDEVLQREFFCNPYRENDKTTVWFRERVREPLRNQMSVLFATMAFRRFNRIVTGELLLKHGLLLRWNTRRASQLLHEAAKTQAIFTGAFIVRSPSRDVADKIDWICQGIETVWRDRGYLIERMEECQTLESAWLSVMEYDRWGPFNAYELVTDLRHTYLLERATDIDTWCALGPGGWRGLARLNGQRPSEGRWKLRKPKEPMEVLRGVLARARKRLKSLPKLEMREIEHSLCEWDKYERVLSGEGRGKRHYTRPM